MCFKGYPQHVCKVPGACLRGTRSMGVLENRGENGSSNQIYPRTVEIDFEGVRLCTADMTYNQSHCLREEDQFAADGGYHR